MADTRCKQHPAVLHACRAERQSGTLHPLQKILNSRPLAHQLRLTYACMLCLLQALVREGMWQSRPTNNDGLAANFLFLEDNMQDVDTFKGVETAVRTGTVPANMGRRLHFLPRQRLLPAALQNTFVWSGELWTLQLPKQTLLLCYAT